MEALRAGDPAEIGPFPLLARLGEGGMGVVYLARTVEGRAVALKTVRSDMANAPGFRQRFAREVRACRAVSGPGMATVIDFDIAGAVPWLATEYVAGPSLGAAVGAHGPLPEDTVRRLLSGLARALITVHAAGLVHRDVKPTNVLLAPEGPLLIDFGIARAADETALTGTGVVIGSPGYMPPEQAVGQSVEAAGDVFSLGAVVTYAATGRGPFGTGAVHELLYRVVHQEPDLAGLPPGLVETVGRMLAKDPRHRPSAEELAALDTAGGAGGSWLPDAVSADITRQWGRLRALQAAAPTQVVKPAPFAPPASGPAQGPAFGPAKTRIDAAPPVSAAPPLHTAPQVRRISRRALFGTGVAGFSTLLLGGTWAVVRNRDRAGSGGNGEKTLRDPSWSYTHDAAIVTSPAPGRGSVVFGDEQGRIASVSQNSHELQWAVDLRVYTASGEGPVVMPVAVDRIRRDGKDVILTLTKDRTLHGLNEDTGERLWTRSFSGDTNRLLPQIGADQFVVVTRYGQGVSKVTVMNAAGLTLMEDDTNDMNGVSLAWDEGDAVALYSLARDGWYGARRWTVSIPKGKVSPGRELPDDFASAAIEADQYLYFHTRRGVACVSVDPSDGGGWTFTAADDSVVVDQDPPVVQGGTAIFRYGEAVYAATGVGEADWKFVADGQVTGRLSLLTREGQEDSLLFFGTDKATVYALNSRSGELIWKHTAAQGTLHGPVLHGESAYVAQDRNLYALDVAGPRWES
ncbi:protein kinase [Streptomyces lateritius]|uniref:Protein kinase n=1 Tax=Streptomyces lateritius TaxID=67313 RepID=A0ABW6YIE2_9ACTN